MHYHKDNTLNYQLCKYIANLYPPWLGYVSSTYRNWFPVCGSNDSRPENGDGKSLGFVNQDMFGEGLGVRVRVGSSVKERGCDELQLLISHQAVDGWWEEGQVGIWRGGRDKCTHGEVGGTSVCIGRCEGKYTHGEVGGASAHTWK